MAYTGQADIGKSDPYKYTVIFDGANLDFYVFIGTPLENLKRYTDFTGTSGVSETWTYGFWTGAQNNAFENTGYNDTYKKYISEDYVNSSKDKSLEIYEKFALCDEDKREFKIPDYKTTFLK